MRMLKSKFRSGNKCLAVAGLAFLGTIAATLTFAAQTNVDTQSAKKDRELLQGVWIVTKLDQVNHQVTQDEEAFYKSGGLKIEIAGDQIKFLQDGSKASFELDTKPLPKQMKLVLVTNGKRVTTKAIYSLVGNKLRICQGRAGDEAPPKDFDVAKAPPGTFPTCFHLERDRSVIPVPDTD
jgi:uncharacterized protein (TIGR03067 family)